MSAKRPGLLTELISSLLAQPLEEESATAQEEPEYLAKLNRTAKRSSAPTPIHTRSEDLDSLRRRIEEAFRHYILDPHPGRMLLVKANAGSGKTTIGTKLAPWAQSELGGRILYAGPRHEFFLDIFQAAQFNDQDPFQWYEWLPRQWGQADASKDTCQHADAMMEWLQRGFPSRHFCQRICKTYYMENECKYHAQKTYPFPFIFAQHQHVVLGHPMMAEFKLIIGDEVPLATFPKEWSIPAEHMHWKQIGFEEPLAEVLYMLQRLAESKANLAGFDLYQMLGIDRVIDACANFDTAKLEKLSSIQMPDLFNPKDALKAGYNVLPELVPLLHREALAARAQLDQRGGLRFNPETELHKIESNFPERISVRDGKLQILSRHHVAADAPEHIIWFDATGDPELYRIMFERDVEVVDAQMELAGRVHQVIDRVNNKSSLMTKPEEDEPSQPTHRAEQLKLQVEYIAKQYDNPTIITFKGLREYIGADTHFYANRGTNQFAATDAIIIAGTPMPPPTQIEKIAKCLWQDRMEPFDMGWTTVDKPYNYRDEHGGFVFPTSQFIDPALNTVLWQYREAELIQSAHRARILYRNVPVYMLTNLPVMELPVAEITDVRTLFHAPEGVDIYKWQMVLAFAEQMYADQGYVTEGDFVTGLGINRRTVRKYMEHLIESGQWELALVKTSGRGRPPKAMTKGT